jgi:aspartate/methionine/tyrosine aminotransferase
MARRRFRLFVDLSPPHPPAEQSMVNSVFRSHATTVFQVMSSLAAEHGAINLGQGFPDEDGPLGLREMAARALVEGPNQYPPMPGLASLRDAVAGINRDYYGLDVDPATQVLVTSGATEALADCFFGLIEPGDEVVVIEPCYDSYRPIIERAGGIVRPVMVEGPDWALDEDRLRAAFSEKTRLLVLNTPHNPTGKVFTAEELALLAELCVAHDACAVADEVYEHLIYDGLDHIPLMSLPGMAERCVRIGSAGKTFSFTGWKVGYITGPAPLIQVITRAHQWVTFTTPPALQIAVGHGLVHERAFFAGLAAELQTKRDFIRDGLEAAGFATLPCGGTYFLNIDIRSIGYNETDEAFCRLITEKAGVAAIPLSAFYSGGTKDAANMVRFCFCKKPEVLEASVARLKAHFGGGWT